MGDSYKGAGTTGGKLGCLASALVGLPLLAILGFLSFYGHCAQNDPCRDGQGVRALLVCSVVAIVATVVGLTVRSFVNRRVDRHPK